MTFADRLKVAVERNNSLLCVGLDPDPDLMGERDVFLFNKSIIDATADLVCAYKPNWAFYEALGIAGLRALEQTRRHIPSHIPVIADAKRGDVGNTSLFYARAIFDTFGFDAVTVNPYLGRDSLDPFLAYRDKGVLVLCRTSNPGAVDFQSLLCSSDENGKSLPLYQVVAQRAREWNQYGNVGLVVGATYPQELKDVRSICPEMTILIPGVGAQGGDLEASVRLGTDANGGGIIINSSRQILYASRNEDYAVAAREAAIRLRDAINSFRP
ncbi:MAG: Orotidine 5'-phosphate decarboxylase [Dehalococcoidia bacterium]|nr:Orotidine 5'-phosphate decarboxylase [Dehalococcoidia bacterium]